MKTSIATWFISPLLMCLTVFFSTGFAQSWKRHVIDGSSRGADGVRSVDVNGDGRLDIATGWEEGGEIRLCIDPGPANVRDPWPSVTVGRVGSPEDAVIVDLDGDGVMDVVSSCEGKVRTMFVHFGPRDDQKLLDAAAWTTEAIPVTAGARQWMYCLPLMIEPGKPPVLIVGSKNADASVGVLRCTGDNPRDLSQWTYHKLVDAGWIMSLIAHDVDGDGDLDVIVTDRTGPKRGAYWLENPGSEAIGRDEAWRRHPIGTANGEVMFASLGDVTGDGRAELIVAVKPHRVLWFKPGDDVRKPWIADQAEYSEEGFGRSKSARAADLDGDGLAEIIITCEGAEGEKSGVLALTRTGAKDAPPGDWRVIDIGGPRGVKYDLIELRDLDGDGDLDLITCEERDNLGVIWYENPMRNP